MAWAGLGGSDASAGISQTGNGLMSLFPAIGVDGSGTQPAVAWQQETASGQWEIYVRRWDGQAWASLGGSTSGGGISNTPDSSSRPDVAIDSQGRVVVAWTQMDTNRTLQIFLRRWNGTSWEELGGSGSGGGISNGTGADHSEGVSLAIDNNDRPVLAWEKRAPWPQAQVYLLRWNGTAWVELGGSASGGGVANSPLQSQAPTVSLDAQGNPTVAWLEGGVRTASIHLRQWNGTSWVELGNSATNGGISGGATLDDYRPAMAVDANGRPTVAWSDEDPSTQEYQIYLKRWTGVAWEELDGSATRGVSNRATHSRSADLQVDALGNPIVAWHDGGGPNLGFTIYLKTWNGSAWEELAGSATSQGVSANSGPASYPNVSLDAFGRAFVTWEGSFASTLEVYLRRWQ